jgi:hypothetical protein
MHVLLIALLIVLVALPFALLWQRKAEQEWKAKWLPKSKD